MNTIHTKHTDPEIHPGATYAVSINGEALYEATVCAVKGCWATVRVERTLPGQFESQYTPGDTFEVKTALYDFQGQSQR